MPVDRYSSVGIVRFIVERQDGDLVDRSFGGGGQLVCRQGGERASHDLPMQLKRRVVRLRAQIRSHCVTTTAELPQCVGTAACQRVQRHQFAMGFLVRGDRVHQRLEQLGRPLVLILHRVRPPESHQQLFANGAKLVPLLRAPVGIGIFGEQVAAIQLEGPFVVRDGARAHGGIAEPLELLHVNPQLAGRTQLHLLLVRQDEAATSRPPSRTARAHAGRDE